MAMADLELWSMAVLQKSVLLSTRLAFGRVNQIPRIIIYVEEVLSVRFAPLECETSMPLPIFSVSLEMHTKIKYNNLVVIKHYGG